MYERVEIQRLSCVKKQYKQGRKITEIGLKFEGESNKKDKRRGDGRSEEKREDTRG